MARTYRMADYLTPDYERAGRAGETVVVSNTETDPRTDAQAYARLGIIAFVTVPFHREGEWKFMLAVGDNHPREWRTGEIQLLRQLSERIFPRIERARAEAALRESEALYHSLFEMMDEGFAVGEIIRDAGGRAVDYKILELNRAYEQPDRPDARERSSAGPCASGRRTWIRCGCASSRASSTPASRRASSS